MFESFDQKPVGELFQLTKNSICPFLYPEEEFIYHSLPSFDAIRGPSITFGREIESNKTALTQPVVLLSKLNPRTSRVTVVDPSTTERRHCCSTEFIAYEPKRKDINLGYYKYLFESEAFRTRLQNIAIGTTNSHVRARPSETLTWDVPSPPLTEQNKITEILMTVDRAIEDTESLIAKQQRVTTGLMQDLLTRGIDENGNLRSERSHRFKDSLLGRIPEEWDARCLENVADFVTSGSRGWAQYYSLDGAVFLRIGNLTRNHINLRLDDIIRVNPPLSSEGKRTSVSAGDLLISITADLGVIGVIPEEFGEAYVNQHIALVRLVPAKVDPRFIGWFLSGRRGQAQFEKLNESGAKAGLNLPTVRKLLVPVMNRSEQTRIAEILDASTQQINEHSLRLDKLRCLKTGLMQDLLTGRKRVTALLETKPKREKVYASQ